MNVKIVDYWYKTYFEKDVVLYGWKLKIFKIHI